VNKPMQQEAKIQYYCLHCLRGCGKVVCLVSASFCVRILFNSLCVMFELMFVFSVSLHYLLVFLCVYILVLFSFSNKFC
jgi:hypothetical protein